MTNDIASELAKLKLLRGSDFVGQSNRVLLNMTIEYNTRLLAADIRMYFETYPEALEVMILKGKKIISIDRSDAFHTNISVCSRKGMKNKKPPEGGS